MHEKADLPEANLNGAILADAKLGGAPLDEGFCCATYTAASDIVTTSDVTPSHRDDFRPRPMLRRNRRLSTPFGAASPPMGSMRILQKTRDDSSRCKLWGPIPARLLEG